MVEQEKIGDLSQKGVPLRVRACLIFLLNLFPRTVLGAGQGPFTVVLGIAQDAGHPQAGCVKTCCEATWTDPDQGHRVSSLAIVDPESGQRWLIDATPDFPSQLHHLDGVQSPGDVVLDGILLTHGHMGHYTGLAHLGREAMGAAAVPVYAMPRMQALLEASAPWELLVRLGNVEIRTLTAGERVNLNERIAVRAVEVPHRGEYTETVGFVVEGPSHSVLFLPDIDKWERWETPIEEVIGEVDRAYLDGTFFSGGELGGRSMADIPHPFVVESMERFADIPREQRSKVHFIHLNHTNPLLRSQAPERQRLEDSGMRVAEEGERYSL